MKLLKLYVVIVFESAERNENAELQKFKFKKMLQLWSQNLAPVISNQSIIIVSRIKKSYKVSDFSWSLKIPDTKSSKTF